MKERMRFAPSPTGFMHIGNLRTAIFGYLYCKHNKGDFIVRIEDTDVARKVEKAVDLIFKTLDLCSMTVDESFKQPGVVGPYIQSERLDIYRKYAIDLVAKKEAYYCFCSEAELEEQREASRNNSSAFIYDGRCFKLSEEEIKMRLARGDKYVIRQKIKKDGISVYEDLVYGKIEVENRVLEDQILLKSDGYPTYNFANVIDDHLMGITTVVRGNEYLMSTAKYNLLYDAFGFPRPKYIHLPLVLGEDGQKLSKRNGDASFMDLYNEGYLSEAIVNYLALLGWSSADNKEIFTMDELIDVFDVKRISKAPATYDVKKLQWVNAHYIKKLQINELRDLTIKHLSNAYDISNIDEIWLDRLIKLYQLELKYGKEIVKLSSLFFEKNVVYNDECLKFLQDNEVKKVLSVYYNYIIDMSDFSIESINKMINDIKINNGIKGKMLYMPIRVVASGLMHGPELVETLYLLGKDKVIDRLKDYLKEV
ncbi:MAG: glutamate--tRNA ligase [bacterium]|nr:glutamate--tRNA ligase [bacterium]